MIEIKGKGGITAKMIADSVSPDGVRLTTLQLRYHRFIHSEFMTHRQFSRNASSSRAIPVSKVIEQVENDPAIPIHWGKNQSGMQARGEVYKDLCFVRPFDGSGKARKPKKAWKKAASIVSGISESFYDAGLHKQIVNRLLEPFQFIEVVVTATEWDNFFNLRLHPDAQPEIQELARVMFECMGDSAPNPLLCGSYHLPYISDSDILDGLTDVDLIKCSVARCARVSYLNHDQTKPDIQKDIALYDSLLNAGHMSPFEHVAMPMIKLYGQEYPDSTRPFDAGWEGGVTHIGRSNEYWSGNFKGWDQYRQLL